MAGDKLAQVEEVLAVAKRLRQAGRYDEAAEILLNALSLKAQADRLFFHLGNVFFDAGDLSRAEYSYRRATEVNPEHVNAHYNLAAVYQRQKKVTEAARLQRKAMMLELRGKGRERTLSPEASRWARKVALQGFAVVGLLFGLIVWLLYVR